MFFCHLLGVLCYLNNQKVLHCADDLSIFSALCVGSFPEVSDLGLLL
jgi:hypothetical protein